MKRISTHVLDIAQGKPAKDVPVLLERWETTGGWIQLSSLRTDEDGRCGQLLPEDDPLGAGLYRITFDTGSYQHSQKTATLYPLIKITFQVREGESQFHIPLLLSPYGYSTYRGT